MPPSFVANAGFTVAIISMGKVGGGGGATPLPGVDVVTLEVGVVSSPDVARGNASDIIGGGRGDRKLVWNPVLRCVVCEEESTFTGFLAFSSAFSSLGSFSLSVHSSSDKVQASSM